MVIRKMLRPPFREQSEVALALDKVADELIRRTAKSVHNLDVLVPDISVEQLPPKSALAKLPELCMAAVLKTRPGDNALLVFDAVLLDALIEVQTVGRVLDLERVDRPVTNVDCKMAEPFMKDLLERLSTFMSGKPATASLVDLSFSHVERDPVRLALDLEAQFYELLSVSIDLGPGVKTGIIQLIVPNRDGPVSQQPSEGPVNPRAAALLNDMQVGLDAFLPALRIPLTHLRGLSVGDSVPMARSALARTSLCNKEGGELLVVQLGQMDGYRAVRVVGDGPPEVPDGERQAFNRLAPDQETGISTEVAPGAGGAIPEIDGNQPQAAEEELS